jgi:hypothetical protein
VLDQGRGEPYDSTPTDSVLTGWATAEDDHVKLVCHCVVS